jgi:hypothetical protein
MAYLAAANVTVTLDPREVDFFAMATKVTFPSIAFGNSSLQYPALGVPLPAMGSFGMKKEIKRIFVQAPPGDGYSYKYDKTNNTMRMYQTGAGTLSGNLASGVLTMQAPTGNVANLTVDGGTALHSGLLTMQAATGNVANTALTITGAAGAESEVVTGTAIVATVLDLMVVGS